LNSVFHITCFMMIYKFGNSIYNCLQIARSRSSKVVGPKSGTSCEFPFQWSDAEFSFYILYISVWISLFFSSRYYFDFWYFLKITWTILTLVCAHLCKYDYTWNANMFACWMFEEGCHLTTQYQRRLARKLFNSHKI